MASISFAARMIPGRTRGIRMLHAMTIVLWDARARYTSRPLTGHAGFPGGVSFAAFSGTNSLIDLYSMGPPSDCLPIIGILCPFVKAVGRVSRGERGKLRRMTGHPSPLRVGRIPYANLAPIFHGLSTGDV